MHPLLHRTLTVVLASACFIGCGFGDQTPTVDKNTTTLPLNPGPTAPPPPQPPPPTLQPTTTPAATQPVPVPAQATAPKTPTISNAAPKLNPQHGQPGHRCDLPVGSPLPGGTAPAQPTQPIQVNPSGVSAPAVAAPPPQQPLITPNSSGLKLNPKHGEPGHRCDIAVGAPLN